MKYLFVLLATATLFSCGSKQTEEAAEVLKKDVFAIHDAVMPQTMKIETLQDSIKTKFGQDTTFKAKGMALNSAMQSASDSMYVWMNALSGFEEMTPEDKVKYLEKQKVRGEAIKAATEKSISDAEAFLK